MIKRPCPHCGHGLADRLSDFDGLREYECRHCCWTWFTKEADTVELHALQQREVTRVPYLGRIGDGKWFSKKESG